MQTKKFNQIYFRLFWLLLVTLLGISGCATTPPKEPNNICAIFREKQEWYDAAYAMRDKWGVPIHVPMAMMYQESSFRHNAIPPKRYVFFGLIPWGRVSSAYGYSQAKTMTWEDYQRETGNKRASRENFADAIDFMGWFVTKTHTINGVSKWDAYAQYLNYHEGWGGYKRKTYEQKGWLKQVAVKVKDRSSMYAGQLKTCEHEFQRSWLWRLFFG